MAIIAILATSGISTFTGYLKKARDTNRISDVSTINKAVIAAITQTGQSPATIEDVITAIETVNNGMSLSDPQEGKSLCQPASGAESDDLVECGYYYQQCDDGNGFAIATKFEAESNQAKYAHDNIKAGTVDGYYSLGNCVAYCSGDCGVNSYTLIQ